MNIISKQKNCLQIYCESLILRILGENNIFPSRFLLVLNYLIIIEEDKKIKGDDEVDL